MSQKAKATMNHLPQEILMEILSRLPVKPLLRFRCVSKPWRSLIADPHFVELHLNRSISSKHQKVLFSTTPLQSIDCEVDNGVTELDCPSRNPDRFLEIWGCCNGLVCFLIDIDHLVVYNPSTRRFTELPQPPEIDCDFFYGFGYDSSIDDYKVVGAKTSRSGETKFTVLNLKDNSWRSTLELSNSYVVLEEVGTFLNGALHWLANRHTNVDKFNVIISFDLSKEVFGEIPLPDHNDEEIPFYAIGVLGGSLCVLSDHIDNLVEVWLMREYGVKASWIKLINIRCDMGIQNIWYLKPLCFLRNGELVLEVDGRKLVIYNPEEGTFRNLIIGGDHRQFAAALYVESLVSPNGGYGEESGSNRRGEITNPEV